MNGQYNIGEVVLNNWTLTRLIGTGSYGRVFEAEREDFGATYRAAVKIITVPQDEAEIKSARSEGMSNDDITGYFKGFVEEIIREVELMSRLESSANVVGYKDHAAIQHNGGIGWDILIRMELLTPLPDHYEKQPLNRQDVVNLGIDICQALELCYKYRIIHRDIKPENIFVSELGYYKLGDFGIARTVEKTSGELTKTGTLTYMAPEISRGEAYGPSIDIYSLGIVLYKLLNDNRTPFLPVYPTPITHSDREAAIAKRIRGEQMPAPKNADGRLAEIVLTACAYDPKSRFSDPVQMRQALEALILRDGDKPLSYQSADDAPAIPNAYAEVSPPPSNDRDLDSTFSILGDAAGSDFSANLYGNNDGETEIAYNQPQPGHYQYGQPQQGNTQYYQPQPGYAQYSQPQYGQINYGQYQYGQSIAQKTENKKKFPLFAVLIPSIAVVIAVILIIAFGGNSSTSQTDTSTVSDPADTNTDSDPAETAQIDVGVISPLEEPEENKQSLQMPYLLGQHYSQARNALDNLGMELVILEDTAASDKEKGYVIETIPGAGDDLSPGNRVTIIYSSGPVIQLAIVPDFVGSTREQLESALSALDITPAFVEFEDESPIGTVLFIERSGQQVEVPTSVVVHISSGPSAPVQPPSTISLSGHTLPPDQVITAKFGVRGIIESNYIIKSVTVAVYNDRGVIETGVTVEPNAYIYDIKNVDYDLLFDFLTIGNKKYVIEATDEMGTTTLLNHPFRVYGS